MPDRRCSAPPRGRAPAHHEPDRGGWPLVLRPRRPQLSLPVRQPAEELPRWRRRHAILRMRCSVARHCRANPANTNSAECYAWCLCSGPSATPAADKAGEQSVAVLRRSVMSACGQVVAHHLADRLRPLPADVTLMDAWDQRQPFGSRLTTAPGSDHACGCIISCRDTTLTIGVNAAVDRVLDHPVDGRIVRPAPDHVAILALGGQVQPMLDEPDQALPDTAEFGDLVEDEDDGFLATAIGPLPKLVPPLH